MKRHLLLALAITAMLRATPAPAQSAVSATIDIAHTSAPISPYIYGQFIEHIGTLIEHGIWAKMLDDRKFFSRVTSAPPPPAQRRGPAQRWVPIGPDASVVMDSAAAYAGAWAPRITLAGVAERGIAQSGLAVRAGRAYVGRIVIAGDPRGNVVVRLVWGANAADRQTSALAPLSTGYATLPLNFTARANSDSARIEIVGTGAGAFRVGAVSLMPANNVEGFRREIIDGLKQLRSGIYRFPGGNFLSGYEWRDRIGDRDRRLPRFDYAWRMPQ